MTEDALCARYLTISRLTGRRMKWSRAALFCACVEVLLAMMAAMREDFE